MPPENRMTASHVQASLLDWSRRGDGRQALIRLDLGGGSVVLKSYGLKRSAFNSLWRHLAHRTYAGKSSMFPKGRCETERRLLRMWAQHGFRVPGLIEVHGLQECPLPLLAIEHIDGPTMDAYFGDPEVPVARKQELVTQVAQAMGERHSKAIELNEPGLVHDRPGLNSILVEAEGPVFFDLEITQLRTPSVAQLASHEILGFLCSLAKRTHESFPEYLAPFVAAYPHREQLLRVQRDTTLGRYRAARWFAALGMKLEKKTRGAKIPTLQALQTELNNNSEMDNPTPSWKPSASRT